MADKKITQLTALSAADAFDVFPIVDISGPETKKITLVNLMGTPGPIGATSASTGKFTTLQLPTGATIDEFSTDGTLGGNSDTALPTEKAVKSYVDYYAFHNNLRGIQGGDSTSEYYHLTQDVHDGLFSPSTSVISVGESSSATDIEVDYGLDQINIEVAGTSMMYVSSIDAFFGSYGITGFYLDFITTSINVYVNTTLMAIFDTSGLSLLYGTTIDEFSTDGTLGGNSDTAVPTEKAVKSYVDSQISGGINISFVYTDSTAVAGDVLLVDTTAGNVNITMTESSDGKIIVKKITTDGNDVIISGLSGTIDGQSSITINTANQSYTFVSDGTDFYII